MCKIGIRKRFSSQRLTHQACKGLCTAPLPTCLELLGCHSDQAVLLRVAGVRRARRDPGHPPLGPQHSAHALPPQAAHAGGATTKGCKRASVPLPAQTPHPTHPAGSSSGTWSRTSGKSPGRTHHGGGPADRDVPAGQGQAPGPAGSARPPVGPPGSHRPRLLSSPGHSQQRLGGQEGEDTLHHLRQVTQHEGAPGVCGGAAIAAAARQLHSSPRAPAAEPRRRGVRSAPSARPARGAQARAPLPAPGFRRRSARRLPSRKPVGPRQ